MGKLELHPTFGEGQPMSDDPNKTKDIADQLLGPDDSPAQSITASSNQETQASRTTAQTEAEAKRIEEESKKPRPPISRTPW